MQLDMTGSESGLIYNDLLHSSKGSENDHILASILSSWMTGSGCLPRWMGLDENFFSRMMEKHFPHYSHSPEAGQQRLLDAARQQECDDVYALLMQNRAGHSVTEEWLARIVAVACQGSDHLWQDLGLWARKDLSALIEINFPKLAQMNDRDMKWKKFLYKQLCVAEGIYTCRSPSCEVCADYANCFGPEE